MSRSFTVSSSEEACWSLGISLSTVQRAINPFPVLRRPIVDGQQVAFARVITDRATFGYLADVFVLLEHRGLRPQQRR